jgi:hypothetical protein
VSEQRGAEARRAVQSARGSWGNLSREQRAVSTAAFLLLASMLLPWYTRTTTAVTTGLLSKGSLSSKHEHALAITTFTFVEAAIFLVAVGVLYLMYARGKQRGFHLPFGDGNIVTAAGSWATFLVFYRFVDQPSGSTSGAISTEYSLSWGIFFGLLAACFLAYTGQRLRAAHVSEPPLPRAVAVTETPPSATATAVARPRRRPPVDGGEQLTFDEAE